MAAPTGNKFGLRFSKGFDPRRSGRKPWNPDFKIKYDKEEPQLLDRLFDIARFDPNPGVALNAIIYLMSMRYGRPVDMVQMKQLNEEFERREAEENAITFTQEHALLAADVIKNQGVEADILKLMRTLYSSGILGSLYSQFEAEAQQSEPLLISAAESIDNDACQGYSEASKQGEGEQDNDC